VLVIEQRKSKRFDLRLPLELVRAGAVPLGSAGETRNLSSSGVLFSANADIAVGDPIEYFITLPPSGDGNNEVRLRCMGKIIRQDETTSAATLERYEFVRE
jgi:PilZ domain